MDKIKPMKNELIENLRGMRMTTTTEVAAMREWIMQAAPMLSVASCIVIDEAVERLGEIAGCRALLELCPVDFVLPENA